MWLFCANRSQVGVGGDAINGNDMSPASKVKSSHATQVRVHGDISAMQRQTTVAAHFSSEQLLLFAFALE